MTSLTARYSPKAEVIATDLRTELVLLDPATQEMFRLNQTGRSVWLGLAGTDVAGLVSAVAAEFAVSPEDATRDIVALLAELEAAGLISLVTRA